MQPAFITLLGARRGDADDVHPGATHELLASYTSRPKYSARRRDLGYYSFKSVENDYLFNTSQPVCRVSSIISRVNVRNQLFVEASDCGQERKYKIPLVDSRYVCLALLLSTSFRFEVSVNGGKGGGQRG